MPVRAACARGLTADGDLVLEGKQIKLRHADSEIRLAQDPFPLYPGATLLHVSVLSLQSCALGA